MKEKIARRVPERRVMGNRLWVMGKERKLRDRELITGSGKGKRIYVRASGQDSHEYFL